MGRTQRKRKRKCLAITNDECDLIDLQKWMKLKDCHLQMRCFPGTGRGLRSKKKISLGDELISLPFHLLITPKSHSDIFYQTNTSKLSPQLVLTIFLMYERHLSESSSYWSYIKLLPLTYSTLFFCTKDEFDVLPCFMRHYITKKQHELAQEFNKMKTFTSNECSHCGFKLRNIFTIPLFNWAWFTVNTRSVYYKDEEYDGLALAPLLDMFNHSAKAEIEIVMDHRQKKYILKSMKEYKRNEEIFIKYGAHSNWKLLSEYGFVMENNPHDFIEFTFDEVLKAVKQYKPEYDMLTDAKYKFIRRNNLDKNLTKNQDEFSWSMNALLYVLISSDHHFPSYYAKCYSNKFNENEWNEMVSITKILATTKKEELANYIQKMKSICEPSESFSSAKKLIEIYISLL